VDINAIVSGLLRDLAYAQTTQPQLFGYERAAAAILALETPLTELITAEGALPKIAGIGPGSARVIQEALETGGSPTVERAIEASGNRADIEHRRALRTNFLSRAEVVANWRKVFATAADLGVAVEIDGDPARQDLDFELAASALAADCLFALDSDAHTTEQLAYVETAIAHARLAGIPADRIVNYWPLERLLDWLPS
jgi:hypothetical protein